jgi:hypothetical protein
MAPFHGIAEVHCTGPVLLCRRHTAIPQARHSNYEDYMVTARLCMDNTVLITGTTFLRTSSMY